MANYGYAFAPSPSMQQAGAQAAAQPPSRAVEIKALNLPQREVPGQIAPAALLSSPGGGGMPTAQLLKMLMQAFAPMAGPSIDPMAGPSIDPMAAVMQQRAQAASMPSLMPSVSASRPQARPVVRNIAPHVEFSYGTPGPSVDRSATNGGVTPSAPVPVDSVVRPSQPGTGTAPGGRIDSGPMAFPVSRPAPSQPTPAAQGGFDLGSLQRFVPDYKLGGFGGF